MTSGNTDSSFPTFPDGDVTVVISTSRVYRLHSQTLRQKSKFFEQHLRPNSAPKLTLAAKRGGHTPWRFKLLQRPQRDGDGGEDVLVPIPINENGRAQVVDVASREHANLLDRGGSGDKESCWDWLFGCFYSKKPQFDSSTFGAIVNGCVELVEKADTIGAVGAVRETVDLALLQQDAVLWKSIAIDPTAWAELGRRIQSAVIFKEAIVHVVGKWEMLDGEVRDALPKEVYRLCETKWRELELVKRAVEIRIAGHYPSSLSPKPEDKPQRSAYANDIYMWMALSLFRHYLSQSGNDCKNRMAEDGGYAWYKTFAKGGQAYLHREDMLEFHRLFPMSSKACGVLEARMIVLKDEVKEFVKDLMVNRTHIDPEELEGVENPWLTCVEVKTEDLPWNEEDATT